jgi:hypothetical protein
MCVKEPNVCGLQINPLSSGGGKPENPEKNYRKRLLSGHEHIEQRLTVRQGFNPKPLSDAHAGQAMPLADCATVSSYILYLDFLH